MAEETIEYFLPNDTVVTKAATHVSRDTGLDETCALGDVVVHLATKEANGEQIDGSLTILAPAKYAEFVSAPAQSFILNDLNQILGLRDFLNKYFPVNKDVEKRSVDIKGN